MRLLGWLKKFRRPNALTQNWETIEVQFSISADEQQWVTKLYRLLLLLQSYTHRPSWVAWSVAAIVSSVFLAYQARFLAGTFQEVLYFLGIGQLTYLVTYGVALLFCLRQRRRAFNQIRLMVNSDPEVSHILLHILRSDPSLWRYILLCDGQKYVQWRNDALRFSPRSTGG